MLWWLWRLWLFLVVCQSAPAADSLSANELLALKRVTATAVSPDGEWVAYTVDVPRRLDDDPGPAYSELHVYSVKGRSSRPFITGKQRVLSPLWRPDGSAIAFLTRRGEKAQTQVWMIPHTGGESTQLTDAPEGVLAFRWHPSGSKLGYIAQEPKTARLKALEGKGYGFIHYEENLRNRNLYMADVSDGAKSSASQITKETNVWSFEFSPDGKAAAVAASPKNLIDQSYLFQQIFLLDLGSRVMTPLVKPDAKLGNFAFSPDGASLAYAAGNSKSDHAVSQAFVIPSRGGPPKNLTPPKYRGHINWVGWKDKATLRLSCGRGCTNHAHGGSSGWEQS